MIRIFLGNPGSGKTACAVREMYLNPNNRTTFSNIITKHIKNNIIIHPDMIVKKTPILTPKGQQIIKGGSPQFKYEVNREFWENSVKKFHAINVMIDEAHSIINARAGMSRSSKVIFDWVSLIRRVLGSTDSGFGELTFISQLERKLDVLAKEMCTHVRYHVCHYVRYCTTCGYYIEETNEESEPRYKCPRCRNETHKMNHRIEVFHFDSMNDFVFWKYMGRTEYGHKKLVRRHYMVNDIEKYFSFYNTLQWDNLLSNL